MVCDNWGTANTYMTTAKKVDNIYCKKKDNFFMKWKDWEMGVLSDQINENSKTQLMNKHRKCFFLQFCAAHALILE